MTLLFIANMPTAYWTYAFQTNTFFINLLPTKVLSGLSPFKMLYGKAPTYEALKVFGCHCFPCMRDYNHEKFKS